jgi:molecular chaperone HtpG
MTNNTTNKTTHKFTAETEKVFKLMIHSLYENKEIFVRELISNASDACDKLRFKATQNPEVLAGDPELKITVQFNKAAKTLTFIDNGIGMSADELLENLGTIARSGTQKFAESLTGDAKLDSNLIGQFGVGFYSVFMVADSVSVISQAAGSSQANIWQSNGDGDFTIESSPVNIGRGTIITLKLKDSEAEFLDKFKLKHIIKTYSNHVGFKITLEEPQPLDKEDAPYSEVINEGRAIWLRDKSEITADEYAEFYRSISQIGSANDNPLITFHNRAEGTLEYTNLLFVPTKKPFDLYHPDRETRVKLYIKKVLISEKLEVIPRYLRFLRGVVDSNDLPLNISRETVQSTANVGKIKTSITKRILKELAKMATSNRAEYLKFWNTYGPVLKEGLCDGVEPRDEILEACLFQTSRSEELTSLKEYKERMKQPSENDGGQKAIYYLIADSREQALASPQIEGFLANGFEVILLTDSVDDFWTNVLFDYQNKPFRSVTKSGADLDDVEAKKSDDKNADTVTDTNHSNLIEYIKNTLGGAVKDVRTTNKLADSPVCLTAAEGAMDIRFERFLVENKQLPEASLKIFEINPKHKIIQKLEADIASLHSVTSLHSREGGNPAVSSASNYENSNDGIKNDWIPASAGMKPESQQLIDNTIQMLFAQACIIEGEPLKDAKAFANLINGLIAEKIAA